MSFVETSTTTMFRVSKPKSRNLLVVNKGPGALTIPRNGEAWDLLEIYFMKADIEAIQKDPARTDAEFVVFETSRQRRKFEIVQTVFEQNDFWQSYDAVMLADDDLIPVGCTVADMFALFAKTGCRVGQPGLTQDSYFSHMLTIKNNNFVWRKTNFAEVMCTMMTRDAVKDYLPMFNATTSGLFLDHYWSYTEWMKGIGCAILDDTPMKHCRPVFGGIAYQGISKEETYEQFVGERGIPIYPQSCIGGLPKPDNQSQATELGLILSGYEHRFVRDTKFLAYAIDELGVALNAKALPGAKLADDRTKASAHIAAIGMFMATRNVGAFVEAFGEHKSPQGIVDTYWNSATWRSLRTVRSLVNRLKNRPAEKKPIVHDLGAANAIVSNIVQSTSWELLGPFRVGMRFVRGLRGR